MGVRWAEQIQVELARSDALITLLSERAVESAMIREEVALAQTLEQAHGQAADFAGAAGLSRTVPVPAERVSE